MLLALILIALFAGQTSGSEIVLSPDGQSVIMPVAVFRAREADIQKGEAAIEYAAKLEGVIIKLQGDVLALQVAIDQERRAHEDAARQLRGPGLGISAIGTTEGDFRVGVGFVWRLF